MQETMRKTIKEWSERAAKVSIMAVPLFLTNTITTYATGGISDSKLATGTQQLIQDLTTFLMVIAPILQLTRWIRKNGITGSWLRWFRV